MTQVLPDGATLNFAYNAAGGLTNRAMPGGLTWLAAYDAANRVVSEQLAGGGSADRQSTYQYNSGGAWAGLLQSKFDAGRGVTSSLLYDPYLRLATNALSGPLASQNQTLTYQYDQRGLATNLTQVCGGAAGATTAVQRVYDGYGQMRGNGADQRGGAAPSVPSRGHPALRNPFSGATWNGAVSRVNISYR